MMTLEDASPLSLLPVDFPELARRGRRFPFDYPADYRSRPAIGNHQLKSSMSLILLQLRVGYQRRGEAGDDDAGRGDQRKDGNELDELKRPFVQQADALFGQYQ